MILYRLTFANGKTYIGQTIRVLQNRLKQHGERAQAGSPLPVHCAWRKYGAPVVETLGTFDSGDDLNAAEIAAIKSYGTICPNGYNLSYGGDVPPALNPEVAAKISAAKKGSKLSAEHKAKVAVGSKANWRNDDYRAKVAAGVAASFTPERRAFLAENARRVHTGRIVSEATLEKQRSRIFNEDTRAKMSESAKARVRKPWSDEVRAKMSAARRQATPEQEERRLAALRAAFARRAQGTTK